MPDADRTFWDAVDELRDRNPAYRREAYGFVVAALTRVCRALPAARRADPERRHISGQELLQGVLDLGRREFGVLAPAVFAEWGLRRGEDVGAVVFALVAAGQLQARPSDRLEDFGGRPDLPAALAAGVELAVPTPRRRRRGRGPAA